MANEESGAVVATTSDASGDQPKSGFAAVKAKWKQGATKFGTPLPSTSSRDRTQSLNSSSHHGRGEAALVVKNAPATTDDVATTTAAATAAADAAPTVPSTTGVRPFGRRASLSSVPTSTSSSIDAAASSSTPPPSAFGGRVGGFPRTKVTTTITTTITSGGKSTVSTNSTHTWRPRPQFSGNSSATTNTNANSNSLDSRSEHSVASAGGESKKDFSTMTPSSILATPKRSVTTGKLQMGGGAATTMTPKSSSSTSAAATVSTMSPKLSLKDIRKGFSGESAPDSKGAGTAESSKEDKVPKTPVRDWRSNASSSWMTPKSSNQTIKASSSSEPTSSSAPVLPKTPKTPKDWPRSTSAGTTTTTTPKSTTTPTSSKADNSTTEAALSTSTASDLHVPNLNSTQSSNNNSTEAVSDAAPTTSATASSSSSPRKLTKSRSKESVTSGAAETSVIPGGEPPRKPVKSKSRDSLPAAAATSVPIAASADRTKSTTDIASSASLPVATPYRAPNAGGAVDCRLDDDSKAALAPPQLTRSRSKDSVSAPPAPQTAPAPPQLTRSSSKDSVPSVRRGLRKFQAAATKIKQAVIYTRQAPKTPDFPVHEKSDRDSEIIWEALYKREMFSALRMGQLNQLVSAFEPCSFAAGDIIVQQGDLNIKEMYYFYIIDRGTVEFTVGDDDHIGTAGDRESFGELSLLYAAPRAATVLALEDVRLFRCDRLTFCTIMSREMQRCVHQKGRAVDGVQFLANASTGASDVRDYMIPRMFRKGEVLVEQGSISETFFVVAEGEVQCRTISTAAGSSLSETRTNLRIGDYFGERNLVVSPLELSKSTYVAASDCLVFCINRQTFVGLVGKSNMESTAMAIVNDAKIRRLEEILFLQKLSAPHIAALASMLKDKEYKYGDSVLVEKENTKAALYLVKSGSLTMASSENCDRKVIKAGSCFGESHMQRAHSKGKKSTKSLYTVTARMDTVCSVLSIKDYWSVVGAPASAVSASADTNDDPVAAAEEESSVTPDQPAASMKATSDRPLTAAAISNDTSEHRRALSSSTHSVASKASVASKTKQATVVVPEPKIDVFNQSNKSMLDQTVRSSAASVEAKPEAHRLPGSSVPPEAIQSDKELPVEEKAVQETLSTKRPSTESTVSPLKSKARTEVEVPDATPAPVVTPAAEAPRRRALIRQSSNLQLEPLKVKLDKLKKHCVLGEGTFGVVWLVSDSTKRDDNYYALKKQSKAFLLSENQVEAVIQEKIMLENMKHPFLICLFATFQDEMFVYMLLDFVQGGELFSLMHEQETPVLLESQAKFYALCLADVLAYLHKSKYVYRDLKPENVMLDGKGYVKLIDFGFCKYLVADKTYTLVGTPGYLSPETVSVAGHSFSSDNWSLGILIYEMIVGSSPFYYDDIDQMELFESIVNDPVKPPDTVSSQASDIILKLLTKDPAQRLGTDKLLEIIEHPWFEELDLDAMRHRDVTAPWVPDVQGPTDTSYFDDWSDLEQQNDIDDGNNNGDISKKGQVLSKRDQKLFEGVF